VREGRGVDSFPCVDWWAENVVLDFFFPPAELHTKVIITEGRWRRPDKNFYA
jgi:hypothetical protein